MSGLTVDQLRDTFSLAVIEDLVDTFYGSVRRDPLIGPIFNARIEDWDIHLGRMNLFWRTVLRAEPGFRSSSRGDPAVLHRLIEELEPSHFERWLKLFREACSRVLPPAAAEHVSMRAGRIAVALSAHLEEPTGSDVSQESQLNEHGQA